MGIVGSNWRKRAWNLRASELLDELIAELGLVLPEDDANRPYLMELGKIVRGSQEAYLQRPCFVTAKETISPLVLDEDAGDVLLLLAQHNLPCVIIPMPITGTSSPRDRSRSIEQPHRVPLHVRREVRVAHRHVDRGVAEELLDGLERHAAHHEVRRERAPEVVRREPLREAGLRAVQGTTSFTRLCVSRAPSASQNTYGPLRCRCALSVAIASSESGTSRVRPPFGVPSWSRQSVRRTTRRPS